jgi:hypothetical protein
MSKSCRCCSRGTFSSKMGPSASPSISEPSFFASDDFALDNAGVYGFGAIHCWSQHSDELSDTRIKLTCTLFAGPKRDLVHRGSAIAI